jgi:hypothetical protein
VINYSVVSAPNWANCAKLALNASSARFVGGFVQAAPVAFATFLKAYVHALFSSALELKTLFVDAGTS